MAELLASPWLTQIGTLVILVAVMGLADWLTTRMIRGTVRRVASRTKSTWDDRIIERKVFARLAHVVPAILAYYGIGLALGVTAGDIASLTDPSILDPAPRAVILLATLVQRVALAFIVVTGAVAGP